jgi:hypothetical protein
VLRQVDLSLSCGESDLSRWPGINQG